MTIQTTLNQPPVDQLSVSLLLCLFLFGIAYAWFVRRLRRNHPEHGYTSMLVVAGNLVIVAGYSIVAGVDAALLLLACMAAAGLPMIIEHAGDHLNRVASNQRRLDL